MLNVIKQFVQDESGLETVEWAIVGGIVVAVGAAIFATIGGDVANGLSPDSSAIVATIEFANVGAAMEALEPFEGGTILHTTLPPEITAQLSEAVED